MYCFNFYYHWFVVIILVQYIVGMTMNRSIISQRTHDKINEFNMLVKQRHRRGLINLFSDLHQPEINARDNGAIFINNKGPDSNMQKSKWLSLFKNETGRVITGAADLLLTPVHWLAHMHDYW
ncbi:unnamed protein product [Rotaria magnacalcarata]|uniref:Uncharacterized protein n=2 Tax=Rotaria magnacalcarata TaxID=392030 RepID=A0A8S3BVM4_9BILA|nr:unnamed protein product [Rotaria magnacalcarata]